MAKQGLLTEKNKKIFLGVLFLLLVVVVVYELNSPGTKPRSAKSGAGPQPSPVPPGGAVPQPSPPPPSGNAGDSPAPAAARSGGTDAARQAELQLLLNDTTPLDLAALRVASGGGEIKRNIFAYYV